MGEERKLKENVITFFYKFIFTDKTEKTYTINLDAQTLNYIPNKKKLDPPAWINLNHAKCENCPLDEKIHKYCPIAFNIVEFFEFFKAVDSYNETRVEIVSPERTFVLDTTVQKGLGSMLGIYMVTSGCPVMKVLTPMVRFHLPFATIEETVFRSVGSYLIGQYFSQSKGLPADFGLDKLREMYIEIQKVNIGFVKRLRTVITKDAFANAIISLDAFAKELPWSIDDDLENLEYLYNGYF